MSGRSMDNGGPVGGTPKGPVDHDPHIKRAAAVMASDYDFLWIAPAIRSKLIQAIAVAQREAVADALHEAERSKK